MFEQRIVGNLLLVEYCILKKDLYYLKIIYLKYIIKNYFRKRKKRFAYKLELHKVFYTYINQYINNKLIIFHYRLSWTHYFSTRPAQRGRSVKQSFQCHQLNLI